MLTYLRTHKIYEVDDINTLIAACSSFQIVDTLPDLDKANMLCVYYLKTSNSYTDDNGTAVTLLTPYLVGTDSNDSTIRAWYTASKYSETTDNYKLLNNKPSINGEIIQDDMNEDKARTAVSSDGLTGGYDLSINDDDITSIVEEALDTTDGSINEDITSVKKRFSILLQLSNGVVVAGSANDMGIYYSTDSGVTWTQSNLTNGSYNILLQLKDKTVIATSSKASHGIIYSTDSGATWNKSNLTVGIFTTLTQMQDETVLATDSTSGIWYSTDSGATWTQGTL